MRVLSLFSGIGGIDLGLERAGMTITGQVEIDEFCIKVLTKHWPNVPKFSDITTTSANNIRSACGAIDLICGGFPCQDISTAGKGEGLSGSRSGLYWEMWRLVNELRPAWLFIENVPALRTRGYDAIHTSLAELGYWIEPIVVGAWAVGAPHRRNRVWIVANANSRTIRKQPRRWSGTNGKDTTEPEYTSMVDAASPGLQGYESRQATRQTFTFPAGPSESQFSWEEPRTTELSLCAAIDGVSGRLALRAIGNAVVPQVVQLFGEWINTRARQ